MWRIILIAYLGMTLILQASIAYSEFGVDVLDIELPEKDAGMGGGVFVDVLEAPSARSKLAPRSVLNGITRAGNRLVAVGRRGHILYSDDQGKTWVQAGVPVSSDLVAVCFPTPAKGWAVGHDGVILHSSDGGATWTKQLDGRAVLQVMGNRYIPGASPAIAEEVTHMVNQGPDKPFLDVWFDNETTGYAVGAFNLIFHTVDGGKVWEPWYERTENPKRLHLYAIRRIGSDLFIVGEQGVILKMDPQRQSFRALDSKYNGTFFGLTGKPGGIVVYGLRGNAYRSTNGGMTWNKVETGVSATLTGATVTEGGRIVIVSLLGNILVSEDGGTTFQQIANKTTLPASAVTESAGGDLALVGTRGAWIQASR